MPDEPIDLPVTRLLEGLASGRWSAEELTREHIARIEAVDPLVNAVTEARFDAAMAEARAADVRRASDTGVLPPLLGVPCTIKEFFAVEGMPWTGGLQHRARVRADHDAVAVQRLRAAGAVILATTNAPEGGLWMETHNDLYGRTNNPWDLRRTSGGSSGGEGALVASGASPFGLGSDIGGSVRIPAAFCGTFGHKPSGLTIPNGGHFPPASPGTEPYLCAGPLARSADDLDLLLEVLSGPDGAGPAHRVHRRSRVADGDLSGVRFLALETNGRVSVSRSLRGAVAQAAASLESRGATRIHAELPGLRDAFGIWSAMLAEASDVHYETILTGQGELPLLRELAALPFGRSHHTFAALAITAADRLIAPFAGTRGRFVEAGLQLLAAVEDVLGPDGVLLHPPYSRAAPRHHDAWRTPLDAQYTAIFNVLELPVTVVPAGFEPSGLPLAVQVAAGRGRDALTLRVARALEADLGGWVRAEPVPPRRGALSGWTGGTGTGRALPAERQPRAPSSG